MKEPGRLYVMPAWQVTDMNFKKIAVAASLVVLVSAMALLVVNAKSGPKLKKVGEVIEMRYLVDTEPLGFLRVDVAGITTSKEKNVTICRLPVANVGADATGLVVTLSGDAIDKKLISNAEISVRSILVRPGRKFELLGEARSRAVEENARLVARFPAIPLKGQPASEPGARMPSVACVMIRSFFDVVNVGEGQLLTTASPMESKASTSDDSASYKQTITVKDGESSYELLRSAPDELSALIDERLSFESGWRKSDLSETVLSFQSASPAQDIEQYLSKQLISQAWTIDKRSADPPMTISSQKSGESMVIQIDSDLAGCTHLSITIKPKQKP